MATAIMRDMKSGSDPVISIAPAQRVAGVNGDEVDLIDHSGALAEVLLGLYTDGAWSFKLQHRELTTDSWVDVPTTMQVGAFTDVDSVAKDNTVQSVSYIGDKRRLRVVATEGSSPTPGTGLVFGALVNRGHRVMQPTP